MKIRTSILLTVAFASWIATSQGQTTTWTAALNSTWTNAGNWSSGIPGNGTTAIFDNAGTSTSLGADRNIGALSSIRTAGNFIIAMSGNLTTVGNFSTAASAGDFILRGAGNVNIGGNLNVAGTLRLGDSAQPSTGANSQIGNVSITGTTNLSSNLFINNLVTANGTSTVNLGSLEMNAGGILNLVAGSNITNGTANGETNTVTVTRLNGANGTITGAKNGANATTTGHLIVNGSTNGSFGGVISNGLTLNVVQLTKSGNSALTLSGNNTYTGNTTVTAGSLFVNGQLAAGSAVAVNGGTLGGNGTIAGIVTVNSGGALAPGNSGSGVLTVGSLVLNGGSATTLEVSAVTGRGTNFDGININTASGLTYGGNLTLSFGNVSALANAFTLDLFNFTGSSGGSFANVNSTGFYTGSWTNSSGNWSFNNGSQLLTFSQTTGDLTIAVPEPSTWLLLALGLTAIVVLRRRVPQRQ